MSSNLLICPPNPPIFHFVLQKTEFSLLIFCPPNPPIRLFVLQNVLQFDQKNGCPLVPFLREGEKKLEKKRKMGFKK
jgi:hypothetical protein